MDTAHIGSRNTSARSKIRYINFGMICNPNLSTYLASVALVTLLACSSNRQGSAPSPAEERAQAAATINTGDTVAFVDVAVIPMDSERVLAHQTVIVRGERIVALGPSTHVAVPEGARTIDGAGKFLMPGLGEMHGHIPRPSAPPEQTEAVLFMYLANGVTTVRGMLGAEGQLALRERANSGQIAAPTLYLAGPSFNGRSVDSPEQATAMVSAQKRAGWNLLKVHPGLTRPEYDAMARAAKAQTIRFGGHVPAEVGLMHALEMGQETFDHIDGYLEYLLPEENSELDEAALTEVVDKTRAAGAWIVPTMVLWETLLGVADLDTLKSYDELRYVRPERVARWVELHEQRRAHPDFKPALASKIAAARVRVLRALHEGGVKILMGTDAPQQFSVPGFSLHRELVRMQDAGMSPHAILRTGTALVGEYFRNEDDFGTVTTGLRADLLLVDGNPLEDLARLQRPAGVMVRGRWFSRADIDERLAAIAARAGATRESE